MKHNVKWFASLSNGETVFEDKGAFLEEEGALSPWWKFQSYLQETQTSITSFGLYSDQGHRWLLPSIGKNSRFIQYAMNSERPISFNAYRRADHCIGEGQTIYTVAEAKYEDDNVIQIYVDNNNLEITWTNLIKAIDS